MILLLVSIGILCGVLNGAITLATRSLSQQVGHLLELTLPGYVFVYVSLLLFAAILGKNVRQACGSGLPELKYILASEMRPLDYNQFTSWRVLLVKSFGLTAGTAVAPLGREGPLVHTSACVANLLMSTFSIFQDIVDSPELSRQVFAASAAVGVASTFNAPVGGLLFSVEVTSTYYLISNYWKSFVAAVAGSIVCNLILTAYTYNGASSTGITVRVLQMNELLVDGAQVSQWEYLVFVLMGFVIGFASFVYLQIHQCFGSYMRPYAKTRPLLLTLGVALICCFVIYLTEFHTPDRLDTQVLLGDALNEGMVIEMQETPGVSGAS